MPEIWPLKSGDWSMLRAHQVVHAVGRVEQVTVDLRPVDASRSRTRTAPADRRRAPASKRREVDARAIEPRRRAGLQPAPLEAERLRATPRDRATAARRRARRAAARGRCGQAVQERPGRDDERAAATRARPSSSSSPLTRPPSVRIACGLARRSSRCSASRSSASLTHAL